MKAIMTLFVLGIILTCCRQVTDVPKNVSDGQPITINETTLTVQGDVVKLYCGDGIGFTVYSNNVAEVWKTGVNEPFLTTWDNSYIVQYDLEEW